MTDQSQIERVYDAVTSLTAEVRSFMERLVRVEERGVAFNERFTRVEKDVSDLQSEQAVQRADLTGLKVKVGLIVAGASLAGGAVVTVAAKLLHL